MHWSFEVEETRTGSPTVAVNLQGGSVVYLHSRFNPEEEAEEWAAQQQVGDVGVVVIQGLGLGYHVRALANLLPEETPILVIDPNANLWRTMVIEYPCLRLPQNVKILENLNTITAAGALFSTQQHRYGMRIFEHLPSLRLAPDFYRQALDAFRHGIRLQMVNVSTAFHLGYDFGRALISNIPNLALDPPLSRLQRMLEGKPVILVASGPSLKKNMHLLENLRGQMPMIAAGSAYTILTGEGIIPDFVVSVDPLPLNYDYYVQCARDETCLIYESKLYPPVVSLFKGPRFAAFTQGKSSDTSLTSWLAHLVGKNDSFISAQGTVASAAFSLARLLGANPIILVGQDLAFTDGFNYAPGLVDTRKVTSEDEEENKDIFIEVPAASGGMVKTSHVLYSFLVILESQYQEAGKDGITVIDATEGGALKKHTVIMSLAEALNSYKGEAVDAWAMAKERYDSFKVDQRILRRVARETARLARQMERLDLKLVRAIESIMDLRRYMKIIDQPDAPFASPAFRKAIGSRARETFERFYSLNQEIAGEQRLMNFLDIAAFLTRHGRLPKEPTLEEKIEWNGIYYIEMLHTLRELLPPLRESVDKVNNLMTTPVEGSPA